MRRIYLASSWRNPDQPIVVQTLRTSGHGVYDFRNPAEGSHGFQWSAIDPEWQTWTPETFRAALNHPIAVEGFELDWQAMEWADTCVLLLPCGRSAHLEAGWFVGQGKELFILTPPLLEPELMYRMATAICTSTVELERKLGLPSVCQDVGKGTA